MKHLFSLLISIILFIASCQPDNNSLPKKDSYVAFPIENAFWTLTHCEFSFVSNTAFVKVGIFGDTLINGKNYHKLYGQSKWKYGNSCSDCNFTFNKKEAFYFTCFREENKKIFIVPHRPIGTDAQGSEYVIYDFNIAKPGDAVRAYPFFFQPIGSISNPIPPLGWGGMASEAMVEYKVKEIREVKMSDGSIRKAYLFDDSILEAWIEGIGTTSGFASFNHVYDISNNTDGFSANGVHLLDIRSLDITYFGDCGINPFTYELTNRK